MCNWVTARAEGQRRFDSPGGEARRWQQEGGTERPRPPWEGNAARSPASRRLRSHRHSEARGLVQAALVKATTGGHGERPAVSERAQEGRTRSGIGDGVWAPSWRQALGPSAETHTGREAETDWPGRVSAASLGGRHARSRAPRAPWRAGAGTAGRGEPCMDGVSCANHRHRPESVCSVTSLGRCLGSRARCCPPLSSHCRGCEW